MTAKGESSVRRAVAKAREVRPVVLKLEDGCYTVASGSRPGCGYLVRVLGDSSTACECKAAEQGLYCYHRATVGLLLGTIPTQFLGTDPCEATPLVQAPKGRSALFG